MIKNSYREKPMLQYQKTSIAKNEVIGYIKSLSAKVEVKRAAFVMCCIESANFQSGVNNNYGGVQADVGRWNIKWNSRVMGTTVVGENKTAKPRRFVVFNTWQDSIDFMIDRVALRGLYIGGTTHLIIKMNVDSVAAFASAYWKEWVTGDPNAKIPFANAHNFILLYNRAKDLFK